MHLLCYEHVKPIISVPYDTFSFKETKSIKQPRNFNYFCHMWVWIFKANILEHVDQICLFWTVFIQNSQCFCFRFVLFWNAVLIFYSVCQFLDYYFMAYSRTPGSNLFVLNCSYPKFWVRLLSFCFEIKYWFFTVFASF